MEILLFYKNVGLRESVSECFTKKNKSKYTLSDHNLNYALNLTENEASGFSFWINFNSDLTCFDAW